MKSAFLTFFFFLPLLSFGQGFRKTDLIGRWKIVKTEFYIQNNLMRKAYLKENPADTIVEGAEVGEMDEEFTKLVKSFTGTVLVFGDNDSFTWDIPDEKLKLINKRWQILPNTNNVVINEWKDKAEQKNGLLGFVIASLENDRMTIDVNDSGTEIKYDLVRVR